MGKINISYKTQEKWMSLLGDKERGKDDGEVDFDES